MYLPQVKAGVPFRILIVEDDPSIVRLAAVPFKMAGIDIFAARDGIEAWEQLSHVNPHLIVTDVKMPRLSGYAFVGRVRRVSVIPVLMMTAEASEEAQVQAFKMGADGYITKPFSPQLLTMRAVAILRRVYSYNGQRPDPSLTSFAQKPLFQNGGEGAGLPRGFVRCDACQYMGPERKFEARDAQDRIVTSCPHCKNKNLTFALA